MTSPAGYVIKRFGGVRKTARAIGGKPTTVQGWKKRGTIPQRHWDKIIEASRAINREVLLEDFVTEREEKKADK